jgi:hypothetical protein
MVMERVDRGVCVAGRVVVSEEGEEKREHPAPKICTHDNIHHASNAMIKNTVSRFSATTAPMRTMSGVLESS